MKTWYGIPSFVHHVRGLSCLRLFAGLPCLRWILLHEQCIISFETTITLLPNLYKETSIEIVLIRIVHMGPWTHNVDDGLETRKTVYETMYTLVRLLISSNACWSS